MGPAGGPPLRLCFLQRWGAEDSYSEIIRDAGVCAMRFGIKWAIRLCLLSLSFESIVRIVDYFGRWESLSRLGFMDSADASQVLYFSGNRRR
jgi:hypothetical protein